MTRLLYQRRLAAAITLSVSQKFETGHGSWQRLARVLIKWIGHTVVPSPVTAGIFILGIASLLLALVVELLEMRAGLSTIAIATRMVCEDSSRSTP